MAGPRGRSAAAAAAPTSAAPAAPGWYESEPPLGRTAGATWKRLVRRARASWRTWVAAAVVFAALMGIRAVRTPPSYEVSILMRVVEGQLEGPALTEAEILAQVDELAFTNERLVALMKRHAGSFPEVFTDPSQALEDFRDAMTVDMFEDDFIEDRQPSDPPRSARITVAYKAPTPDLAWTVAHELKTLLIESGLQQQRERARSIEDAATKVVRDAEGNVAAAWRDAGGIRDRRTDLAQARLGHAQSVMAEAAVASSATAARLALRFDVIDPGRRPPVLSRRAVLGWAFTPALFLSLLVFSLVAGAYDPRVLDADDLGRLGFPVLASFPALGHARGAQAATETE